MGKFIKKLLLAAYLTMNFLPFVYGDTVKEVKTIVVDDRIKWVGRCDEYNLNLLTASDRSFFAKRYPSGIRCPSENRVGRCLNQKISGMVFDSHYYTGIAKGYDWQPSSIKVTCKKLNGKYEDG